MCFNLNAIVSHEDVLSASKAEDILWNIYMVASENLTLMTQKGE